MQKYFNCFSCNKWKPIKQKVEVEIEAIEYGHETFKKVKWCKACKDKADGNDEKITSGNLKDLINSGEARIKT